MQNVSIPLSSGLDAQSWYVVNDDVMGGISKSEVIQMEDAVRFQGTLSLENNGGFASMRKEIEPILQILEESMVRLQVRGDGQTYECRFRMKDTRISYVHPFDTKAGEVTTHVLPIKDFQPSFRGRKFDLDEVGHLDLSRLNELSILIASKQVGPFQIEVSSISL